MTIRVWVNSKFINFASEFVKKFLDLRRGLAMDWRTFF
jgi:hypothetical protein